MINGEGPTSTTYGRGQVIILILLHFWVLRMNTIVLENTDSFPGLRCGWRQLLSRLQWTLGSGDHIHWQWRGGWQRQSILMLKKNQELKHDLSMVTVCRGARCAIVTRTVAQPICDCDSGRLIDGRLSSVRGPKGNPHTQMIHFIYNNTHVSFSLSFSYK